MGQGYDLKCSVCEYRVYVTEGVGMMYSPNAVFYGRCDDPNHNWSIGLPDGYCEDGKPLLINLIKSKKTKDKAFELLANGAVPDDDDYGHELFLCPKCLRLSNRFYFKLLSEKGDFEPDYSCSHCGAKISYRHLSGRGSDGAFQTATREIYYD